MVFGCNTHNIVSSNNVTESPFSVTYRIEGKKLHISIINTSQDNLFLAVLDSKEISSALPFNIEFKETKNGMVDYYTNGTPLSIYQYRFCLLQKSTLEKYFHPYSIHSFVIPLENNMKIITSLSIKVNYLKPSDFQNRESLAFNSIIVKRKLKPIETEIGEKGSLK
jgi:hypothetical protein